MPFLYVMTGGHDNGYYGPLAAIQTMGLQEKLIVLQSYSQMGAEIGRLRLPVHKIDELFMSEKLDNRPTMKPRARSDSVVLDQGSQAVPKRKKKAKKKNQVGVYQPEAMKSDPVGNLFILVDLAYIKIRLFSTMT
jgi:hypothetical protein